MWIIKYQNMGDDIRYIFQEIEDFVVSRNGTVSNYNVIRSFDIYLSYEIMINSDKSIILDYIINTIRKYLSIPNNGQHELIDKVLNEYDKGNIVHTIEYKKKPEKEYVKEKSEEIGDIELVTELTRQNIQNYKKIKEIGRKYKKKWYKLIK